MWKINTTIEKPDQVWKCRLQNDDGPICFGQVISLWQHDPTFCAWFTVQLRKNQSTAIRWETPGLTTQKLERQFEFVIVNAPSLDRNPNQAAFASQFESASRDDVIAFANLGRNAMMVVPTPAEHSEDYCHLLSFLRNSERAQSNLFWKLIGQQMEKRVSEKPVWLSTAGGGVAWLHARLDDRPKYYCYQPYREEMQTS